MIDWGETWIKSYRKILNSRAFKDPNLLKVWIYCLHKANYEEKWVKVKTGRGDSEVLVKPGQFIFGRKQAAKDLSMKPSSVRNRIKKLKNMRNLDIQADTHYSIITICNWELYQGDYNKLGQGSGQPKDNQRTGIGQPKDTDKKVKKVEKDNNKTNIGNNEVALRVFNWYKFNHGKLPGIRKLTKGRIKKIDTRIINLGGDGSEWELSFNQAVVHARNTPFMLGDSKQGWKADFDWFIEKDENIEKTLEGKYDGKQSQSQPPKSITLSKKGGFLNE
jgi:hypothetical protein